MMIPDLGKGMTQAVNLEFRLYSTYQHCDVTSPQLYGRSLVSVPSGRDGSAGCSGDENVW